MAEKETIILDFQVEQGDAISELEKTKKSIILLKQEQQELNKAYKAGNVTIEEYASEQVRLEGILKKQTNQYNTVQKSVTGVKTQFDKLIDSNKGIQKSLESTSGSIAALVPGFSQVAGGVQTVTTASKAFIATPIGAVIAALAGVVSVVVAALKKSEPVLDFFEDIIVKSTAAIDVFLVNLDKVAKIIGNVLVGNFAGAIAGFNGLKDSIASAAEQAQLYLDAARELEDAQFRFRLQTADAENQIKALVIQAKNRNLTFQEQETLLLKALDLEKKLVRQRQDLAREEAVIGIKQIALSRDVRQTDEETFDQFVNNLINSGKFAQDEADKIVSLYEGQKRAASESLAFQEKVQNQLDAIAERREAFAKKLIEDVAKKPAEASLKIAEERGETEIKLTQSFEERNLAVKETARLRDLENKKKTDELIVKQEEAKQQQLASLQAQAIGFAFQLAGESKGLQSALTLISTYFAAQKAYESQFLPIPTPGSPIRGGIAAAIAIASGLKRVADINDINFGGQAAGGGKFMTKGPTMLLVGDNPGGVERVTVEPVSGMGKTRVSPNGNLIAMAGGGVLETQSITSPINQAFAFRGMMDKIEVVASWKEATELQSRIKFKEALTQI